LSDRHFALSLKNKKAEQIIIKPFRLEESGQGGLHSSAGGMAKEMAVSSKHDPFNPTGDLYCNKSFYDEGNLTGPRQKQRSPPISVKERLVTAPGLYDSGYGHYEAKKALPRYYWDKALFFPGAGGRSPNRHEHKLAGF